MTKITIDIDGAASVSTPGAGTVGAAQTLGVHSSTAGGNDAGSAPSVDSSHTGPVAFTGVAGSAASALNPAFSPEGAISAGPAPTNLMGGTE
jgi:hypothetical protein